MSLNLTNLETLVEDGYINKTQHPFADLYLYNYTQITQFEGLWTTETLSARGLILDKNGEIISRPFSKFFNIEEHDATDIPSTSFKVYEKLDGSCGILYWLDNKPFIATRGSFLSDQAQKANELLLTKYRDTWDKLDRSCTYIFEIIYPNNRIVVDYGKEEKLVLLAIRDTKANTDLELIDIGFPIVNEYNGVKDFSILKDLNTDNKEGFVLLFENGFRVKIKFEEYVRLHRIITGVSNKIIWEHLKNGESFNALLDKVPDEFYEWVKLTRDTLTNEFNTLKEEIQREYDDLAQYSWDRKLFASLAIDKKYSKIMFAILDNKDISSYLWNIIKPKYSKPFTSTETV